MSTVTVESPTLAPVKLSLTIGSDCDAESPSGTDGNWTFYSFRNRDASCVDRNMFFKDTSKGPRLRRGIENKINAGLAYFCDCYERSGIAWSIEGEGMRDGWDTSSMAGILVWEHKPSVMGVKTKEDRKKDANRFLDTWNDWVNGNCYWFGIEDANGDDFYDPSGGFIGDDGLVEEINGAIPEGAIVYVTGSAAWLLNYKSLENAARVVFGEMADDFEDED